jgi:Protein of unknown function (DUF2029).
MLLNSVLIVLSFGLLWVGLKTLVTTKISFGADFSIYWQAGRALFLHGVSPYDASTTAIIQQGIYGRLAHAGEDQLRYAYPPFSLLVILPSVWMSYPWAQAYWMALNLTLVFIAVLLLKKKPPLWLLAGLIFFYPIARGVILGQFAFIIGTTLIICYGLLYAEEKPTASKEWLAGGLLAWAAMKPHLSGLVLFFFFLDALRKRQWRLFAGFAVGLAVLAGVSWLLGPTWVGDWIHLIFAYVGYVPIQPIIGSWLGTVGMTFSSLWLKLFLIALAISITIWLVLRWWKERLPNFLLLAWLVLLSQLVNPNPNSLLSDQIVFLLPLLFWLEKDSIRNGLRAVTWGVFVLLPWMLFFIYFHGKEPYAVASGLAMLFAIWFVGTLVAQLIKPDMTPAVN